MSWPEAIPAILLSIGVFIIPGGIFLLSLGFRGIKLLALSPLISISIASVCALLFPQLSLDWSLWWVIVATVIFTVITAGVQAFLQRKLGPSQHKESTDSSTSRANIFALSIGIATMLLALQFIITVGAPDNFAQEADNILHLNMTRYIIDIGNASPLTSMQLFIGEGRSSFYPNALHGITALVAQTALVSIPVAQNVVLLILVTLVWSSGIIWLTHVLFRSERITLFAGPLSAAFTGFPLMILGYAGILPYLMAISILPSAFALFIHFFRTLIENNGSLKLGIVLLSITPALLLSHTSIVHALVVLSFPFILMTLHQLIRREKAAHRRKWVFLALVYFLGVLVLWTYFVPQGARNDFFGLITSMGQLALHSYNTTSISFVTVILVLVGLLGLWLSKKKTSYDYQTPRWLIFSYILIAVLYVLSAATTSNPMRDLLTAPWYANPPRIYALTVVIAIPIASYGLDLLFRWLTVKLPQLPKKMSALNISVLTLLIISTQALGIPAQIAKAQPVFQERGEVNGWLQLSDNERELISRLPELVPSDTILAGSHYTGASYSYMLTGIKVLTPQYMWQPLRDSNMNTVRLHLNELLTNPKVCQALSILNIEYVLDFGPFPGDPDDPQADYYLGFEKLIEAGVARQIYSVGDAKLLKIIGC